MKEQAEDFCLNKQELKTIANIALSENTGLDRVETYF